MARYTTIIPDDVNELLKDAAKRNRQSKEQFIQSLFETEANKEEVRQKKENKG